MEQSSKILHSVLRIGKVVGVLTLSVFILAGCFGLNSSSEGNEDDSQPKIKSVKVEIASKQKVAESMERTAVTQASVQHKIAAKLPGTIQQVLKNRGEFVNEGEVILKIDSPDVQTISQKADMAVQDAQEALSNAKGKAAKELANSKVDMNYSIRKLEQNLDTITKKYNKVRNDFDVRLATREQLAQAENEWKSASDDLAQLKLKSKLMNEPSSFTEFEKGLRDAQTAKEQANEALSALSITAPTSGILTGAHMIQAGADVQPGDEIGVIQKLDPMLIKANLSEVDAKLIRGKKELGYHLAGTTTYLKGQVNYIADIVDPETKTYELIIQVPNQELNLKPGMNVQVQLTNADELVALGVPTYSIIKDGEDSFVYVLVNDIVEKRKVTLGRLSEPFQEVLTGVKEGEQVVVSGQNLLVDKEKVQRQ